MQKLIEYLNRVKNRLDIELFSQEEYQLKLSRKNDGGFYNMRIFGNNSKIIVNGKTYVGNNIIVDGDTVIVDGIKQDDIKEKQIVVQVLCNVDKIESDESIYIKGNVKGNVNAGTNVSCDDIQGNVRAGTSINCDDIYGDATAGTSINCDIIQGNVRARRIIR